MQVAKALDLRPLTVGFESVVKRCTEHTHFLIHVTQMRHLELLGYKRTLVVGPASGAEEILRRVDLVTTAAGSPVGVVLKKNTPALRLARGETVVEVAYRVRGRHQLQ